MNSNPLFHLNSVGPSSTSVISGKRSLCVFRPTGKTRRTFLSSLGILPLISRLDFNIFWPIKLSAKPVQSNLHSVGGGGGGGDGGVAVEGSGGGCDY